MEEQKKKKVALIHDYIRVFSSDEGQAVLKDLMENSYLLQPTAANTEAISLRNEGKRELMLYILHNLSYDVKSLLELIDDTKNENREKKSYENKSDDDEADFFRD